jgi:hypothetical protein
VAQWGRGIHGGIIPASYFIVAVRFSRQPTPWLAVFLAFNSPFASTQPQQESAQNGKRISLYRPWNLNENNIAEVRIEIALDRFRRFGRITSCSTIAFASGA